MKRRLTVLLVIVIGIAILFLPVSAEDGRPVLTAEVQGDGSVVIQCFLHETEYDTVNIYKQGETVIEGGENNPFPLIWWVAWHGRSVTYPGINQYPIYYTNRASELSNGAGSALPPGKYYAILLGQNDSHLTEPVEFEILENSSPSVTLPTQAPVALPTAVPPKNLIPKTASAAATASSEPDSTLAAESPSPQEPATAAAGTMKTTDSARRTPATAAVTESSHSNTNGKGVLWIGIAAAAAILIAVVIAVLVKKKKT